MDALSASERKNALRREVLARRDAVAAKAGGTASAAICSRLTGIEEITFAESVAAFWPLRGEVDLRPLMAALAEAGKRVALPVMTGETLVFRRWRADSPMQRKPFGVMEPEDGEDIVPELILMPLVAFDRTGGRLGYGKGFYDRALAARRKARSPMTIGIAFAIQEVASLPLEPHDQRLDAVVTEAETIRFSNAR